MSAPRTRAVSLESSDGDQDQDLWPGSLELLRVLILDSLNKAIKARGHVKWLGSVDEHTLQPPPFHEYLEWYREEYDRHTRRWQLLQAASHEMERIKREREE